MDNNLKHAGTSIDRMKEISTWVSSVQDLDQLLELIIETATRMMDAKASSLLLLDPKTQRLYFKVATGEKKDDVKQFEIDLGQGIAGHVAQTVERLLIPNVLKDPRWYKEISESIGFQTQSIACVPMKLNDPNSVAIELLHDVVGQRDKDAETLVGGELLGDAQGDVHVGAVADHRQVRSRAAERGPAYDINLRVFRTLQGTITGWPTRRPAGRAGRGALRGLRPGDPRAQ